MQGGKMQIQVVHPEPELVVDRYSEVQRWDLDPMLIEVKACPVSQAVSEVAQEVNLCLSGPDECTSLFMTKRARGSPPLVQVDFLAIQEGAAGGGPAIDAMATTSTEDFIAAFKKMLTMPVLSSPPQLRQIRAARARARELDDSELVPKRSARLAAKSKHREPKPEARARKVMMKRLGVEVEMQLPDNASFDEFQTAFALPLAPSTREAMRVLFPGRLCDSLTIASRHRCRSLV
jgi:hypothetical protein